MYILLPTEKSHKVKFRGFLNLSAFRKPISQNQDSIEIQKKKKFLHNMETLYKVT